MKRKIFTAVTVFILCTAAVVPESSCIAVQAEAVAAESDYVALSGVWKSENTEETLTLTPEALFVYHTRDAGDIQGYLEYVDEYDGGNGRYDMYNRVGVWLMGFYLDSEDSLHMGNGAEAVFYRTDENLTEENTDNPEKSETGKRDYVLMSNKRYTNLSALYNNSDWNGGYFYSDMTEDCMTVIVNCSALNDNDFTGNAEEYMEQFASLVSESEIKDFTATKSEEYTEKFTYPACLLEFTTGANEDTCKWSMLYFQTDTHTFAYAYRVSADFAEEMAEEYKDAIDSLTLTEITETDSGNHASQNAALENYEAQPTEDDGRGDYIPDEDGRGDYIPDEEDGRGDYIPDEEDGRGDNIPDEDDGRGDYIPDEDDGQGDYIPDESDGIGDYIPDDYADQSDPGDTYYWYDGEGNVMYFDGSASYYMGPDDVFYIDGEGHLCEY